VSATAPITATYGSAVASLPAGPLAAAGGLLVAGTPLADFAGLDWGGSSGPAWTSFSLHLARSAASPVPASVQGGDLVLELTAPTPLRVLLRLRGHGQIRAPGATLDLRLDLDDDGSWEIAALRTLGPVPTRIRIALSLLQSAGGDTAKVLGVECTPVDGPAVEPWFRGCLPPSDHFRLAPTFGGDLLVQSRSQGTEVVVPVFGLDLQPSTIGNRFGLPCLLMPRPDVWFVAPSGDRVLAIPPGLPPFTMWAQAVVLDLGLLPSVATTEGFFVSIP
jgi:hypothetical protein